MKDILDGFVKTVLVGIIVFVVVICILMIYAGVNGKPIITEKSHVTKCEVTSIEVKPIEVKPIEIK